MQALEDFNFDHFCEDVNLQAPEQSFLSDHRDTLTSLTAGNLPSEWRPGRKLHVLNAIAAALNQGPVAPSGFDFNKWCCNPVLSKYSILEVLRKLQIETFYALLGCDTILRDELNELQRDFLLTLLGGLTPDSQAIRPGWRGRIRGLPIDPVSTDNLDGPSISAKFLEKIKVASVQLLQGQLQGDLPSTTTDMLYSRRFELTDTETDKAHHKMWTEFASEALQPVGMLGLPLLEHVTSQENSGVIVRVQVRGGGKSKDAYHLRHRVFVCYITMATRKEPGAVIPDISAEVVFVKRYYEEIASYIRRSTDRPEVQFAYAQAVTSRLIYAALIHSLPGASPDTWFRYQMQPPAQNLQKELFVALLGASASSIEDYIDTLAGPAHSLPVIFFDEVGELLTPSPILSSPFMSVLMKEHTNRDRPLFEPFCRALVALKGLGCHTIICGTTLRLTSIVTGELSALKPTEVLVCTSKQVVTASKVVEILGTFFPGITDTIPAPHWTRWAGRPRIFFEYFLLPLCVRKRNMPQESLTDLRKFMLDHEDLWYGSAVSLLKDYIKAFADDTRPLQAQGKPKLPIDILHAIFHHLVFQDRKSCTYSLEVISALIDAGVVFCDFEHGENRVRIGQGEPAFFDALTEFFLESTKGDVLKDPLVSTLFDKLLSQGHGSDATFEDLVLRLVQLLVHTQGLESLFGSNDHTLSWYRIDFHFFRQSSTTEFLKCLLDGLLFGLIPPTTALPDGILPLIKLPRNLLPAGINLHGYDAAPPTRLIVLQMKFYVLSNLTADEKSYAMKTTDLSVLYSQRKGAEGKEAAAARRKAMEILASKPDYRDWSLRAVFISGVARHGEDAPVTTGHMTQTFVYIGSHFFPPSVQDKLAKAAEKWVALCKARADALFAGGPTMYRQLCTFDCLNMLTVDQLRAVLKEVASVHKPSRPHKKRKADIVTDILHFARLREDVSHGAPGV